MKVHKKTKRNHHEAPGTKSSNTKVATGNSKQAKSGRTPPRKQAGLQSSNGKGESYTYRGKMYQTKAALVVGYLDTYRVLTGTVSPPSVADFVRETGVQAGHGMYGARLHEYCHFPRKDNQGTYTIDRRALRSGRDGRVYQAVSDTKLRIGGRKGDEARVNRDHSIS